MILCARAKELTFKGNVDKLYTYGKFYAGRRIKQKSNSVDSTKQVKPAHQHPPGSCAAEEKRVIR